MKKKQLTNSLWNNKLDLQALSCCNSALAHINHKAQIRNMEIKVNEWLITDKKKNRLQKYFMLFCICFNLFTICCSSGSPEKKIVIQNGELDLGDWDFQKDGLVQLAGNWKFRWMDSSPEFRTKDFDDSHWEEFRLPQFWNWKMGTSYGYAWFRLKIHNIKESNLGIYLLAVQSSYELYANGKLVLSNGYPGNNRQESIPFRLPQDALLPHEGSMVLAWKISNFNDIYGGPCNNPVIGRAEDLKTMLWERKCIDSLLLGIIIIMGIYHLLLWFFRKKDKASLYFALTCIVIIIRTIVVNYHLRDIFPFLNLNEWRTKPDLLSLSLGWSAISSFFFQLFPAEFNRKIYRFLLNIAVLFSLIVLFTPSWIYMQLLIPYWLLTILSGIWIISIIIRAARHHRQGAVITLVGSIIIFLTLINDIIYSHVPSGNQPLIQVGLVSLIVTQSAVLCMRFTNACRTAEHLSGNLQEEVKHKTVTITRQNRKLRRLNREKTLFFINLAHELKTPLTLINNYLDKYIKTRGSNTDSGIIQDNFHKLKNDIINFLDYEKLLRGQIIYNHTAVIDLAQYLQKKIILFRESARQKKITLISHIDRKLYSKIDPAALDRLINNLLDNALKFTGCNGTVHINLTNGATEIKLAVRDNGIGIPIEKQRHIFKPYYQASHNKFNTQGMGMGLNIIKKIMEEVGGKITLYSEQGKGTTITLQFGKYLPGDNETIIREFPNITPVRICSTARLLEEKYEKNRKNILIVEDNMEMLVFLQHSLYREYNVFCSRNGQEALNRLNMLPLPDLIISDIMMDVMDGYALHSRLTQMEEYQSVPFIFLSAKTSEEEKLAGLTCGAVDYISKPFNLAELLARIRALLHLQEAQHFKSVSEIEQKILQVIHSQLRVDNGFERFEKKCTQFELTQREKDVLELIFQARDYKEIAGLLGISYPTVRTHTQHIFQKCRVVNKMELLRIFKQF